VGWGTPPGSWPPGQGPGWGTPEGREWDGGPGGRKAWPSSQGDTAESSPQSGAAGPLHLEEEDTSEEEEEEGKQDFPPPLATVEPEGAVQATMWLGTEDGTIHVYNCTDNIRSTNQGGMVYLPESHPGLRRTRTSFATLRLCLPFCE
jgi:hypothetical protein